MEGVTGAQPDNRKRSDPGNLPPVKKAKVATDPVLLPGLVENIPPSAGPWARKSIQRWGLGPPYDPKVNECSWEAYFRERAALEHRLANELCPGFEGWEDDEDNEEDGADRLQGQIAWPHEFPMPRMRRLTDEDNCQPEKELAYAQDTLRQGLVSVLSGCADLPGACSLVSALDTSAYILDYEVEWDGGDLPRTLEMRTRLYAPSGTGMSLDIKYDYHNRPRACSVEFFTSAHVTIRRAQDCCPTKFEEDKAGTLGSACLFKGDYDNDKRYLVRSLAKKQNLREWEKALLGRSNAMSERKIVNLVVKAAGLGCFHDKNDWCLRVARRKMKLATGEHSGNHSSDDFDSKNSSKKPELDDSEDADGGSNGSGGYMLPHFLPFWKSRS